MAIICIDGVNGSGKTTQLRLLETAIKRDFGRSVTVLVDPGVMPEHTSAWVLRDLAKNGDWRSNKARAMLYMSSRCELVEYVKDAVSDGHIVLLDRYTPSFYVYQREYFRRPDEVNNKNSVARINALFELCEIPVPDLTFILLTDPKIAATRMLSSSNLDTFESRGISYIEQLNSMYSELLKNHNVYSFAGNEIHNVTVSDNAEQLDVHNIVLEKVKMWYAARKKNKA